MGTLNDFLGMADAFSEGFDSGEELLKAIRASSVSSNYKCCFHFIFKSNNEKQNIKILLKLLKYKFINMFSLWITNQNLIEKTEEKNN